jgi:methylated-DNA-[protein]-cysteine S-methyltransferase
LHQFVTPLSAPWGTPFQKSVWDALLTIPYGQTVSYGDLAIKLNKPQAVRAVGAAVGKNPWSIVVPCHRVVGANGSLTGYAGGLDRKKHLLSLEVS